MKQMFIVGHGGPEKLQLRESSEPIPARGEVRIRVKASGINFADILARQGLYIPTRPRFPAASATRFPARWTLCRSRRGPVLGRQGRLCADPLRRLFGRSGRAGESGLAKPDSLSHEQAAAIPVNYLTAWQLRVVMGLLKREETVLIHNPGGGVGLAAIDIARHIGAMICGTASSGKNAFLLERGLHEAIDYRTKDWGGRTGPAHP
jgi:NADPH:quinone reductase-like Zn-dependent oxidoreductase